MIVINDYDPKWPEYYQDESTRIREALGHDLLEISHIGSTAIPHMPAKPVIDILLVIQDIYDIDFLAKKLEAIGYQRPTRQMVPHVSFFTKRIDHEINYHLHLHEVGSPQISRHIHFRDYLIHHPVEAKEYADLKINLAQKYSDDRLSYVTNKSALVQQIDSKAKQWKGRRKPYLSPFTGPAASEWTHERLIKASVANYNCHLTHFAQYINEIVLIRAPGYTIINSSLPDDTFNLIIDTHLSEENIEQKINDLTEYFTRQNIPFSWWVGPTDTPTDLENHMKTVGYKNTETSPNMYLDLDAWKESDKIIPDLKIIQIKDLNGFDDFARVLTNDEASYRKYYSWIAPILSQEDPFEYYVGYVDGVPVARAVSVYFGQVAGLYWLSTSLNSRMKGYGRALLEFHLKRAKELGYHIAVLQASDQGYPLYIKLGYQHIGAYYEFQLDKQSTSQ